MKEIMKKNCVAGNESNEVDVPSVLSVIIFITSVVMWIFALNSISKNSELFYEIYAMKGNVFSQCWETVSLLWGVSVWFKRWIITAVASTAVCWAVGGFFSLTAEVASFFLPIVVSGENYLALVNVSLSMWMFIIGLNVVVFIL